MWNTYSKQFELFWFKSISFSHKNFKYKHRMTSLLTLLKHTIKGSLYIDMLKNSTKNIIINGNDTYIVRICDVFYVKL